MKPTDIVMDALYRNSQHPTTRYKGVLAPDGRTTFRIVKSEDKDGMEGKYVVFEEHIPLNQDFWDKFTLADPVDITEPETSDEPVKPHTPSVKKELILFDGEFSVKELAEKNGVQYPIASVFLKEQEASGLVKRTREERRNPKGPMTQLFSKV